MITAERIKDGTMTLKTIPTARLLIEYRASSGELKNMMAMEIEERHGGNGFGYGRE